MDRLTAIQVLVEVVDRGSLTAAADAMGMSRAMASRYVAELERWLDVRLLHRSTRKISLTGPGADVLSRLRQMLDLSGELETVKGGGRMEPHGDLRVAASTSLGSKELSRAAAEYVSMYPGTHIHLQLAERTVNLIEDRIDLAVRITNELAPGVIARKLTSCHSVIAASPDYIQKFGAPKQLRDLEQHNCLTHSYVGNSVWRFQHADDWTNVAVTGNLHANDANALLHMTLIGAGVTLLPRFLAAPYLKNGRLVLLLPDAIPETFGLYGVYSSRKNMPILLRSFLDFLVKRYAREDWDMHIEE